MVFLRNPSISSGSFKTKKGWFMSSAGGYLHNKFRSGCCRFLLGGGVTTSSVSGLSFLLIRSGELCF